MALQRVDAATVERLYRQARAERWDVPKARFTAALERGLQRAFPDTVPTPEQRDRHPASLHLEDLAMAADYEASV